ncbi:hypothetical protein [Deinococcus hopiensis]|uniref:Uncharacterized protein n=1 Tax=Deinococcus hopiensis KR-140 TaxID=695939 RepID=A0A1W1UA41_9DEIO|nr:hypothetical protein [Deinococcus hopiensis]SMB77937.1 hypothetical protein SAMN00790413_04015 [Deinococcus hopiensis KR-140]
MVREIGVYDLYDLKQAVHAVKAEHMPEPLESFTARVVEAAKPPMHAANMEHKVFNDPFGMAGMMAFPAKVTLEDRGMVRDRTDLEEGYGATGLPAGEPRIPISWDVIDTSTGN